MTTVILSGVVIAWVVLYTVNFGRWAWSRGERRGAVGVWLLAAAVIAVPLIVAMRG